MITSEEAKRTAGGSFELTATDRTAVDRGDSNYINNKGAALYREGTYAQAVEYYRLAAAMGNIHAVSNLGYCYLYGRDTEPDTQLAIAYFKTAAAGGDVDAAYKLGDIYSRDKWGLKDPEMSVYYYRMAASFIIDTPWENSYIITYCSRLRRTSSVSQPVLRARPRALFRREHAQGHGVRIPVPEAGRGWLQDRARQRQQHVREGLRRRGGAAFRPPFQPHQKAPRRGV